jgi:hypothetical protein
MIVAAGLLVYQFNKYIYYFNKIHQLIKEKNLT